MCKITVIEGVNDVTAAGFIGKHVTPFTHVLGMTLNCSHNVVRPDRNIFPLAWTLGGGPAITTTPSPHLCPGWELRRVGTFAPLPCG